MGLIPKLKWDFASFSTITSFLLAAVAAVFWIISEEGPDISRLQVLGSLALTLGLAGFFGLIAAGVHIAILK